MRVNKTLFLSTVLSAAALSSAPYSGAQEKAAPVPQISHAYDVTRESVVQGTVISYTAASAVAPIGPHAKVQTAAGVVDVHLGNAQLLKQNDVFLASGDAVSIVGETMNFASSPVFVARVLRKGSQTVTLRNLNGIPMLAKPPAGAHARSIAGGAQ